MNTSQGEDNSDNLSGPRSGKSFDALDDLMAEMQSAQRRGRRSAQAIVDNIEKATKLPILRKQQRGVNSDEERREDGDTTTDGESS